MVAAALPAAAESRSASVSVNGALKAQARYNDGADELCAQAYNFVSGARAAASISTPATGQIDVFDEGGDNVPSCRSLPAALPAPPGVVQGGCLVLGRLRGVVESSGTIPRSNRAPEGRCDRMRARSTEVEGWSLTGVLPGQRRSP